MYLYKSYCYSTLSEVSDSLYSEGFLGSGAFVVSSTIQPDNVSLKVRINLSGSNFTYIYNPRTCSSIGFNNSYSGMSVQDSIELGGLVTLALISVWAIKIIRRAT